MEQVSLIKPDRLSGFRVDRKRVANLPCPQPIASLPFAIDSVLLAVCVDLFFVVRLKDGLPRYIESRPVIPHIHDFLLLELFSNCAINSRCDSNCISDRRFSPFISGLHAEECQTHGPIALIRILVMEWNADAWWIFCCCVNSLSDLCARSCTINVIQLLAKEMIKHRLELRLSSNLETAEKNRTTLADLLLDRLAVLINPFDETDPTNRGLSKEGNCLIGDKVSKADSILCAHKSLLSC